MSEFKFACPICGQHITADSKDTGSQISCPTCYRKIVVPQAPAMDDPKFVLSASEANKPRPPSTNPQFEGFQKGPEKMPIPIALVVLLVLACGAGATLFALRGRIFHSRPHAREVTDGDTENNKSETQAAQPEYTGTNRWTLDLSDVTFPEEAAAGAIHHRAFTLDRATLTGSNLTLRVGRSGAVELGINIYFFNRQPEELSGKTAEVKPTDGTAPRVVLHWKEANRVSETFHHGYAMKVEFGPLANGALPGKIFVCLPDESRSWIAGTFRAEIRKPSPPRTRPPATHQYQAQ
jgi:DNA-directed RNA polymerase subunit RPC12/RpoP